MSLKKSGLMVAGMLACVLAGAGVERVRQILTTVPAEEPDPVEVVSRPAAASTPRTVVVKDEAAERAAAALRRRVAELEQALAERDSEPVPEQPKPQEVPADRSRRMSGSERMEQLKKENPEQYAEMQKQREEFRQRMEQRAQERVDFFSLVDTKNMNDVQKENHAKLLATVARVNELMVQMSQPGVERSPDLHNEMHASMASLGELYGQERRFLLEETGRAVGYQGTQASEFADQMQAIIDNTTMPGFGRHGNRGGPPAPAPAPATAR